MTSSTESEPKFVDYIDVLPPPPRSYESLRHKWEQLRQISMQFGIPIVTSTHERKPLHDIVDASYQVLDRRQLSRM